jgi:hypothetical protein
LATLFVDGAHPVPCGSDCMTYDNLSDGDAQQLLNTVKSLEGKGSKN